MTIEKKLFEALSADQMARLERVATPETMRALSDWRFEASVGPLDTLGLTEGDNKMIRIQEVLMRPEWAQEEDEVLMHELAHAVAALQEHYALELKDEEQEAARRREEYDTDVTGHGPVWRAIALKLGVKNPQGAKDSAGDERAIKLSREIRASYVREAMDRIARMSERRRAA